MSSTSTPPAREQLHQPGDERLQQRVQLVVSGRGHLDEGRHAVATAPVHAVQHQAVQVDVEVGGRAEALDQRDGAAVAFVGLEPGLPHQMARDHALYHLQHRRDQFRLRGQQQAQRDRQGQHPLPHWDMRDDVVHQVRRGLRHTPRAARRAEPATLAAEGQQLVVAHSSQRTLRKPCARMPQSRKASNSSLTNRGSSDPVLASV
nr:hypothetical protein [Ideonella sp. A 288]